jgi:hypothetical protein
VHAEAERRVPHGAASPIARRFPPCESTLYVLLLYASVAGLVAGFYAIVYACALFWLSFLINGQPNVCRLYTRH